MHVCRHILVFRRSLLGPIRLVFGAVHNLPWPVCSLAPLGEIFDQLTDTTFFRAQLGFKLLELGGIWKKNDRAASRVHYHTHLCVALLV